MARGLAGFAALCAVAWLLVWAWARLPLDAPLTPSERAEVMSRLRAALDRAPSAPVPLGRPLVVTLYDRGAAALRVDGASVEEAAAALSAAEVAPEVRARGRLKVDVILGRAPIATRWRSVFALSLVPGLDGIGLVFGDREVRLLPDDLLASEVLAAAEPAGGLDLTFGLDVLAVQRRLATLAGASAAGWAATPRRFYRFRTDGFIERANHDGPPLLAVRGNVPGPAPSTQTLLEGARAGGAYLLRHLAANGRFEYEYATTADQPRGDDYSLPRHAGATYFLAQLYGSTRDPAVAAGAKRALAFLEGQAPPGCRRPGRACVGGVEDPRVDLGASALALLAAVEYARTTGDATFQPWAKRLAAFLRFMQKPAGDFCHRYEPASDRRDEHTRLLYYSGEAAFALARFGAPADALRGALDHLTGPQYGHLAGQFFFLEDHWTCMAAEAAWEVLPPDRRGRYARFCEDFAAFLRRTQFSEGEAITRAQPDFAGAYGFTPLLPPHGTPVGSRSETAISILAMAERRGAPARVKEALRTQILAGTRFLLSHQITDDAAWLMPNPEAARGGLLMSDVNRYVRIDFVQHACSAMLRAADLL